MLSFVHVAIAFDRVVVAVSAHRCSLCLLLAAVSEALLVRVFRSAMHCNWLPSTHSHTTHTCTHTAAGKPLEAHKDASEQSRAAT
jgi:hypothetical protein